MDAKSLKQTSIKMDKRRPSQHIDDSVVSTEGLQKGVQCLRSPPPVNRPSIWDTFGDKIGEVMTTRRTEDVFLKSIERYLRLDSTLTDKKIQDVLNYVKNPKLCNSKVAKKIKHFFMPDKILMWQGLAVYIIKSIDPTVTHEDNEVQRRPSNISVYSFNTASIDTSVSTNSSKLPAVDKDGETFLPEKIEESENSSYQPGIGQDLDRNISHVDADGQDETENKPQQSYSKTRNDSHSESDTETVELEISSSLGQQLHVVMKERKQEGISSFFTVAKRVQIGVRAIRAIVRAALRYNRLEKDDWLNTIHDQLNLDMDCDSVADDYDDDYDGDHDDEDFENSGARTGLGEKSGARTSLREGSPENSGARTGLGEKSDARTSLRKQFTADGTLLVDILEGLNNSQKFYDAKGRQVLYLQQAIGLSDTDLVQSLSLKGFRLSGVSSPLLLSRGASSSDQVMPDQVNQARVTTLRSDEMDEYNGLKGSERQSSNTGVSRKRSKVFQETFFNDDRSEAVSVSSRRKKPKFYVSEGHRLVCLPGRPTQWAKIVDESGKEVINIYGRTELQDKIFNELGEEIVLLTKEMLRQSLTYLDENDRRVKHKIRENFTLEIVGSSQESLGFAEIVPETLSTVINQPKFYVGNLLVKRNVITDGDSLMTLTDPLEKDAAEIYEKDTAEPHMDYAESPHMDGAARRQVQNLRNVPKLLPKKVWTGIPTDHPVAPDSKLDAITYMEKHGINQLFEMFLNNLVLEQPARPIDYLIDLVRNRKICEQRVAGIDRISGSSRD